MKFEKLKKVRSLHDPNNGRELSKPAKFYASLKAKVMIERVCPFCAEARPYPSEHRNNQV